MSEKDRKMVQRKVIKSQESPSQRWMSDSATTHLYLSKSLMFFWWMRSNDFLLSVFSLSQSTRTVDVVYWMMLLFSITSSMISTHTKHKKCCCTTHNELSKIVNFSLLPSNNLFERNSFIYTRQVNVCR